MKKFLPYVLSLGLLTTVACKEEKIISVPEWSQTRLLAWNDQADKVRITRKDKKEIDSLVQRIIFETITRYPDTYSDTTVNVAVHEKEIAKQYSLDSIEVILSPNRVQMLIDDYKSAIKSYTSPQ